jgi:polysaccharide biosynthesis protein PslH
VKSNEKQNNKITLKNILSNSKIRYIDIFLFFKLNRFLKQSKFTHLIIEHPYFGWLGVLLKRFCKVRLIVHSHNIEALRFKSTGKWWWKILWHYEKWTYTKASSIFFITNEDLEYAVKYFKLKKEKCSVLTYGIEIDTIPTASKKESSRAEICKTHSINTNEKILLFNGTLDYKPNLDAVKIILEKINPALFATKDFKYKIIICGKGLPASFSELKDYVNNNIIYAGFVDDIRSYFLGADIFINPVIKGGGIKTKLVEALGYNLTAVSTETGAIGVSISVAENKMCVVKDNDWKSFTDEILKIDTDFKTPHSFFNHFYWGNIAAKAAGIITSNEIIK